MHIKFYAEPSPDLAGHWDVIGARGERTFLLDTARSKAAAMRLVRLAERTGRW